MKITLELWDDQSDFNVHEIDTSTWILKVNGTEFPKNGGPSLMDLPTAHKVIAHLLIAEEIALRWGSLEADREDEPS